MITNYDVVNLSAGMPDPDLINGVFDAFLKLMDSANQHDVDKHLSFYLNHPGLTFVLNTEIIHGWDTLRSKQILWWKNGHNDVQYKWNNLRIACLSDTLIATVANLSSERTGETGEILHANFAFSATWLKSAKGWRIVNAHETMIKN